MLAKSSTWENSPPKLFSAATAGFARRSAPVRMSSQPARQTGVSTTISQPTSNCARAIVRVNNSNPPRNTKSPELLHVSSCVQRPHRLPTAPWPHVSTRSRLNLTTTLSRAVVAANTSLSTFRLHLLGTSLPSQASSRVRGSNESRAISLPWTCIPRCTRTSNLDYNPRCSPRCSLRYSIRCSLRCNPKCNPRCSPRCSPRCIIRHSLKCILRWKARCKLRRKTRYRLIQKTRYNPNWEARRTLGWATRHTLNWKASNLSREISFSLTLSWGVKHIRWWAIRCPLSRKVSMPR